MVGIKHILSCILVIVSSSMCACPASIYGGNVLIDVGIKEKTKCRRQVTVLYVREYKALWHSVLISNIYSPVDQLFTLNGFPVESTHLKAWFSLPSYVESFVWESCLFKCAFGIYSRKWLINCFLWIYRLGNFDSSNVFRQDSHSYSKTFPNSKHYPNISVFEWFFSEIR